MKDDNLDLPLARPGTLEVLPPERRGLEKLTERQQDVVLRAKARAAADFGTVVKDVVAIIKIRQKADADIQVLEAETRKVVEATRVEIERLRTLGNNVKTRGQVALDIIRETSQLVASIPDSDDASRRAVVETLRWVVEAAVKDGPASKPQSG